MSDDCPPQGVRRPNPADLLEHDDYSVICADLRSFIRGRFAAAHDRVSVWQLSAPPETRRSEPAFAEPARGTRGKRVSR